MLQKIAQLLGGGTLHPPLHANFLEQLMTHLCPVPIPASSTISLEWPLNDMTYKRDGTAFAKDWNRVLLRGLTLQASKVRIEGNRNRFVVQYCVQGIWLTDWQHM